MSEPVRAVRCLRARDAVQCWHHLRAVQERRGCALESAKGDNPRPGISIIPRDLPSFWRTRIADIDVCRAVFQVYPAFGAESESTRCLGLKSSRSWSRDNEPGTDCSAHVDTRTDQRPQP